MLEGLCVQSKAWWTPFEGPLTSAGVHPRMGLETGESLDTRSGFLAQESCASGDLIPSQYNWSAGGEARLYSPIFLRLHWKAFIIVWDRHGLSLRYILAPNWTRSILSLSWTTEWKCNRWLEGHNCIVEETAEMKGQIAKLEQQIEDAEHKFEGIADAIDDGQRRAEIWDVHNIISDVHHRSIVDLSISPAKVENALRMAIRLGKPHARTSREAIGPGHRSLPSLSPKCKWWHHLRIRLPVLRRLNAVDRPKANLLPGGDTHSQWVMLSRGWIPNLIGYGQRHPT